MRDSVHAGRGNCVVDDDEMEREDEQEEVKEVEDIQYIPYTIIQELKEDKVRNKTTKRRNNNFTPK